MIRRGNSGRGEGATDSCRASRRKSIRSAGGVSTVFAAAVLFPPYYENVAEPCVFHGLPPGAITMPAARYRDVGIARDKLVPPTATPFIRKQHVAADHRVPRGAASRSARIDPSTKRTRRVKRELDVLVRRILRRGGALIREKDSVRSTPIFITGGEGGTRVRV